MGVQSNKIRQSDYQTKTTPKIKGKLKVNVNLKLFVLFVAPGPTKILIQEHVEITAS